MAMTVKRTGLVGGSLLLVFLSGSVVGALGHRLYSAKTVVASPKKLSHEAYRQKYMREMETRLKLTPDQKEQLVVILDETRGRYKAARERMDPEMKQIQSEQRSKVRGMLSDIQRAEYEKMLEERERANKERGPHTGGY